MNPSPPPARPRVLTALSLPAAGAVARTAGTTNTTRETLSKHFDDLRTQINQLASDAVYNGINLLNGDSAEGAVQREEHLFVDHQGRDVQLVGPRHRGAANTFQADSDINTALTNLTKRGHHPALAGLDLRLEPLGGAEPPGVHA